MTIPLLSGWNRRDPVLDTKRKEIFDRRFDGLRGIESAFGNRLFGLLDLFGTIHLILMD